MLVVGQVHTEAEVVRDVFHIEGQRVIDAREVVRQFASLIDERGNGQEAEQRQQAADHQIRQARPHPPGEMPFLQPGDHRVQDIDDGNRHHHRWQQDAELQQHPPDHRQQQHRAEQAPSHQSDPPDAALGRLPRESLSHAACTGDSTLGPISAPQLPFGGPPGSIHANPLEALDRQRIVLHRLGVLHKTAQHLVVAGGADAQVITNRPVLWTGVEPPGRLEIEDGAVALTEHGQRVFRDRAGSEDFGVTGRESMRAVR